MTIILSDDWAGATFGASIVGREPNNAQGGTVTGVTYVRYSGANDVRAAPSSAGRIEISNGTSSVGLPAPGARLVSLEFFPDTSGNFGSFQIHGRKTPSGYNSEALVAYLMNNGSRIRFDTFNSAGSGTSRSTLDFTKPAAGVGITVELDFKDPSAVVVLSLIHI